MPSDLHLQNPAHPGPFLREEIIVPLGLSVTRAAEVLGVTRAALSALLNGRASLSPEMALRVEKPSACRWTPCSGCRPVTTSPARAAAPPISGSPATSRQNAHRALSVRRPSCPNEKPPHRPLRADSLRYTLRHSSRYGRFRAFSRKRPATTAAPPWPRMSPPAAA